jgi:phosphatidylglycerophosphatase A
LAELHPIHPGVGFLLRRPSHFLALGLGSGLSRFAPGTFGTLAGWLLFYPLSLVLVSPWAWATFLTLAFVIGVWACGAAGRDLGVADHGAIVFDEMVAIWCVLAMLPHDWRWQLGGVLVFRFFDILKPQQIRYFDRHIKGGFGVMWDDLFAAFYSLLLIALAVRIVSHVRS